MATKKKTVHSESASRKLFGAYNDMKLKNSYAQAYMGQKHSSYGNLAKKQTTEILTNDIAENGEPHHIIV